MKPLYQPDSASLQAISPSQTSASPLTTPLLEVTNLHYAISGRPILQGVNLTVQPSEIVVLAGRNGCGKSVLARHIRGLIPLKRGRVEKPVTADASHSSSAVATPVATNFTATAQSNPALSATAQGKPSSSATAPSDIRIEGISMQGHKGVYPGVGLVFQDPDLQIVGSSVQKDIAFGPENLRMEKGEIARRVQAIGEQLELTQLFHRRPHTLSGGEKRRVAMAGVMIMQPKLLILDEPFVALDYPMIKEILAIILELQRQGTATLIITHDLEVCLAHADRLALMADGKIISQAPPKENVGQISEVGLHPPRLAVEECTWLG